MQFFAYLEGIQSIFLNQIGLLKHICNSIDLPYFSSF